MSELLNYFNQDELAASVWKSKYALEGEETPDQMHRRMAKEFSRIERSYIETENSLFFEVGGKVNYSLSEYGKLRKDLTEESVYNLFKDFKYIVPQGSIMSQLGNNQSIGSLSNCFVVGQPEDSYGGIFHKDEELAQLMKRRGGVGIDISTLRPSGASTSNAAKSSTGAVSFMERFSNTTREVAQNGRRGALMISIDIRHPDVMDFIKIKQDLTKVTGANISVMVRDDFMKAVEEDGDYILRFPCNAFDSISNDSELAYNEIYTAGDGTFSMMKIKAKEYWDALIEAAHGSAEPGIIFIDQHWNYSPDGVYEQYRGVTTNPCGEIFMQPYDACRLMALNLFSFVENPFTPEARINFDKLYEIAYEQQRLADDLIDLEVEKIERIIQKITFDPEGPSTKRRELFLWNNIKEVAQAGRRTGCGFTGLGDMLTALGVKYDSEKGQQLIDGVMREKMKAELDCTIDLAILRGSFEGFDTSKEFTDVYGERNLYGNSFYEFIWKNFRYQAGRMQEYGRRNVSWSTVAPTGSVSILTQTTSGLEPLFAPYYTRKKKVNPGDEGVRVDFTDDNGDNWMEYPVLHPQFKNWIDALDLNEGIIGLDENENYQSKTDTYTAKEIEEYFKLSPWYQSTANDIDWTKRVEIQSIIQKFTTHSISSTINLPNDVSVEEVDTIYLQAWKSNLKGVTVYRDGCRSGVLVTDNSTVSESKFEYNDSPKRPKELDAEYYFATSKGRKYAVVVGLLDEKPYEIFAFENPIEEKHLLGKIIKVKKGVYKFTSPNYTIDNLQLSSEYSDEKLLTRFVSSLLRHGVHPKFVIEQTEKSELEITSFGKVLVRTLKRYIKDGEKSTVTCNNCGSDEVVFQEGCLTCMNCGDSKCG